MKDTIMHPEFTSTWVQRLAYAVMIAVCTIALLLVVTIYWRTFLNAPPIKIESLNPPHLGKLCPGASVSIDNRITIDDEVIVHYFVSVMDEKGDYNYPGTQRAYTDYLHPHPTRFVQKLSWVVPELKPGTYLRVFAVRKVSGNEDTVFTFTTFDIGECHD